jgi:hypothetical protein
MSPNNLSDIQDVSPFIGLPPELWDRIAGKLDKKTLDAATRASHLFRRLLIRPLFYKARLEAPHEQLSSKLQHILKSDLACRNLLDPKKYVQLVQSSTCGLVTDPVVVSFGLKFFPQKSQNQATERPL